MTHQMKHLCGFSVFHCVEGAFGASSGGTPKMKNGAPRDELKNGRGRGWAGPYLNKISYNPVKSWLKPNGVFQTVFFRFLASACDRGKPFQSDTMPQSTSVFRHVGALCPCASSPPSEDTTLKTTI